MSVHPFVVEAFTGVSMNHPVSVKVKVGKTVKKIFILFGEVLIPFFTEVEDLGALEKKHMCKIQKTGQGLKITPNVVEEIIEKEGVLCSMFEEHRKALKNWIAVHGAKLIYTILK